MYVGLLAPCGFEHALERGVSCTIAAEVTHLAIGLVLERCQRVRQIVWRAAAHFEFDQPHDLRSEHARLRAVLRMTGPGRGLHGQPGNSEDASHDDDDGYK
jgi:hypothetical protein